MKLLKLEVVYYTVVSRQLEHSGYDKEEPVHSQLTNFIAGT